MQPSADIYRRACEWLLDSNTGVSSKTLCAHMLGIWYGNPSAPLDWSDWERCVGLLMVIPEWIDRLDEMAMTASTDRIVISGGTMRTERGGWAEQVPLIRERVEQLRHEEDYI